MSEPALLDLTEAISCRWCGAPAGEPRHLPNGRRCRTHVARLVLEPEELSGG